MSVFSNTQIRDALTRGHIVCHPLIDENIRGSSIDVTLGEWYYECGGFISAHPYLFNPFYQWDVEAYFGDFKKAEPYTKLTLLGIPADHPVIVIPAKQRILAHTHEFIGINPPGTTELKARSSWGRNGVAICMCSGWGDPGYINRWTMEIFNFNDVAIVLPIGERIGQIVFHETGAVKGSYGDGGKYQGSTAIDQVVAAWTPEAMLPRAYADERRMPLPL